MKTRRKLWVAVAAMAVILAAFVGFLLVSTSSAGKSVRIRLSEIVTNQQGEVLAWFSVSNAWKEKVVIRDLSSESRHAPLGPARAYSGVREYLLLRHESVGIAAPLFPDMREWRGCIVWYRKPTQTALWGYRLRDKISSVLPALKPDLDAWNGQFTHTNWTALMHR